MTETPDQEPTQALSRRELRESRQGGRSSRSSSAGDPAKNESAEYAQSGQHESAASAHTDQLGGAASAPSPEPGEQTPGGAPKPERAAFSGLAALIRKHPNAWLAGALGVAFMMLGTGAVFAGVASGGSRPAAVAPVPTETAEPRAVPGTIPAATLLRTCSVAGILADPRLTNFAGYVTNANTGEVLLDRSGLDPQRTGSVMKTLTAAAAINTLGAGAQLTTQVLDGSSPGVIVLKGGGDPTLSTRPSTVYSGAPQISDLARAAVARYNQLHPGVPITQVVLDSTMWNPDDRWDASWLRTEQSLGYQAEVTALMVDGGRADPAAAVSPRTSDPIGDAGRAFATAAGLGSVTFTTGAATGSTVLAEVRSQPLEVLIAQMMSWSDNVLAENLARVTSIAMGLDGSSASLNQAIPSALTALGLDTGNLTIADGSGLSPNNAVPPAFVASLMTKARTGEQNLGIMYNALPVSGTSGTLAGRFVGANSIAVGAVIAKTGWIDSAYTLGGVVNAADGTPLAFMFASVREGISADAKEAQDTLATGLFTCGNNLSNN